MIHEAKPISETRVKMMMLKKLMSDKPFVDPGAGQPVKEATTVFRMEMANGNGPYNSGLSNSQEIYETISRYDEPDLCCVTMALKNNENMNVTGSLFREAHGHADYGCDSLDSIAKWFPLKAREYLKRYGARIVLYEIPVGEPLQVVGNGEVIFNRHSAKRLGQLDAVTGDPQRETSDERA